MACLDHTGAHQDGEGPNAAPSDSPFNWNDGQASQIGQQRGIKATKSGKTREQIASEAVQALRDQGKDPGTVRGLSKPERVLAHRHGGNYSKAGVR